jgi:hypothetical protein
MADEIRGQRVVDDAAGDPVRYSFVVQDLEAGRSGWRREVLDADGQVVSGQPASHAEVLAEMPDAQARGWADHPLRVHLHELGEQMAALDNLMEQDTEADVEEILRRKDGVAAVMKAVYGELRGDR